jgi:hypothetical protein
MSKVLGNCFQKLNVCTSLDKKMGLGYIVAIFSQTYLVTMADGANDREFRAARFLSGHNIPKRGKIPKLATKYTKIDHKVYQN